MTDTIPVAAGPWALAFHPREGMAYVMGFDADAVSVLDLATKTIVDTFTVGDEPADLAITPAAPP